MEIIAGSTSPLYNELLEKGLTNTSFSFESLFGYGYGVSIFSGESKDPKAAAELIRTRIAELKATGVSQEDFDVIRRKLYGRLIMSYNDVDDIAHTFVNAHFDGEGIFDPLDVFRTITKDDVNEALRHMMRDDFAALSVINPIEQEN